MSKFKKILKFIWDEFVYGGHIISLGAVSVVFTAAILLSIKITWDFLLFIYTGTHSVYLYNRYKEIKKDFITDPERTEHLKKYSKAIPSIIIFLSLIFFGILLYFKKRQALILAIVLFISSFLYTTYLKKITKQIVAFKSFFVSLIWAFLVLLLIIYYSAPINLPLFLIIIYVYLRLFVHEEFSNIKDIKRDEADKLLTLATIFNKKKLFRILNWITILSSIPIIIGLYLKILPNFSIALLLIIPYSFYCLKKENEFKTKFLYYILVDGEPILWLSFIVLTKSLFL